MLNKVDILELLSIKYSIISLHTLMLADLPLWEIEPCTSAHLVLLWVMIVYITLQINDIFLLFVQASDGLLPTTMMVSLFSKAITINNIKSTYVSACRVFV